MAQFFIPFKFQVNRDDRQTTLARSTTPSPPPATSTPVSSLPLRSQLVTSTPYISSPTTPGSSPSSPTPSPYNIVDGLGYDYADALEGFEAVKLKAGSHRGSIFGEGAKVINFDFCPLKPHFFLFLAPGEGYNTALPYPHGWKRSLLGTSNLFLT